ncbi:LOW QUALITY PROTEIN: embryonal Fyn-associated substrate [Pelodiscus sinensis]|uniref:LOW QUALITY PROTEIN: embryonal Fyn-associated substrate n=1 Tax=Pelodiscus sinensis TaxID=13735 RepID=UPI003F6A9087
MSAPLARALFDNVAECPEELSFRRGDLMLVLRPEVPGLAGWRLCSLHGHQGIVPANRVRLLPEPGPPDPPRGRRREAEEQEVYVVPPPARPDEIYEVPRGARREGDPSELYDVPCSLPWDAALSGPYDVPPPAKPPEEGGGREEEPAPVYAAPSNLRRASALLNLYEAPEELLGGEYDLPGPPGAEAGPGESLGEGGGRPRLPSAESLSRRPLPALPSPGPPRKASIQDRPLPPPPPRLGGLPGGLGPGEGHDYEGIRLAEEYDYVHLKGTDKLQPPTPEHDPPEEAASPQPETPLPLEEAPPSPADTELLQFYAGQCRAHADALLAASQALLGSAGAGQPPGAFVPHGRAVIVATHKLLFVGDALARRAASGPLRVRLGAAAGALGQALRGAVLSLKGAALSYPSAPAARLLGERLAQLSRHAQTFAGLLGRLAPAQP